MQRMTKVLIVNFSLLLLAQGPLCGRKSGTGHRPTAETGR